MDIWNSPEYGEFKRSYRRRLEVFKNTYGQLDFPATDIHEIEKTERMLKDGLAENPVPRVCATCYKAYGA